MSIRFERKRIAAEKGAVLARRIRGTRRYLVVDYTFRAVSGRVWIAREEARTVVASTFRALGFVVDPSLGRGHAKRGRSTVAIYHVMVNAARGLETGGGGLLAELVERAAAGFRGRVGRFRRVGGAGDEQP